MAYLHQVEYYVQEPHRSFPLDRLWLPKTLTMSKKITNNSAEIGMAIIAYFLIVVFVNEETLLFVYWSIITVYLGSSYLAQLVCMHALQ